MFSIEVSVVVFNMAMRSLLRRGHHGCDRMAIEFITTHAICAYHH